VIAKVASPLWLRLCRSGPFVVSEQDCIMSLLSFAAAFLLEHQRIELGFQAGI
jgi:hypothetical protein